MKTKNVCRMIFTLILVVACSVAVGTTTEAAKRKYTENDVKYMAAIIFCEAGNQSYAGKVAVGCVVMNRVKSPRFPNTVLKVIKQPYQFGPVRQGKFAREVKNVEKGKYSKGARRECLKAAQEVLEGQTKVTYKGRKLSMKKYHFFNGRLSSPKLRIGGHAFK
nr:cell wall hydrolase [Eubacterium sp.]